MDETTVRCLIIINDGPYGNERSYNGLRPASALSRKPGTHVDVFLVGDGVHCATRGQSTPDGYYNVERMLQPVLRSGRVFT